MIQLIKTNNIEDFFILDKLSDGIVIIDKNNRIYDNTLAVKLLEKDEYLFYIA